MLFCVTLGYLLILAVPVNGIFMLKTINIDSDHL